MRLLTLHIWNHAYLALNSQKWRVLLNGYLITANFRKFSPIFDKHVSKFHQLNFGIGGDKIQNVLWNINNMSMPPSLQYIFIRCGTNNIGHNDPEVIWDGLVNLARVIKKKYKDVKIFISSLLPRDKANSQKRSLVIATNIYLKEACNVNSFSFVELDSGWIVGSSLNMLLFKNDHIIYISQNLPRKTIITLCLSAQLSFRKTSWNSIRTTSSLQLQISDILHLKQRRASAIIICLQSNGIIYWYS